MFYSKSKLYKKIKQKLIEMKSPKGLIRQINIENQKIKDESTLNIYEASNRRRSKNEQRNISLSSTYDQANQQLMNELKHQIEQLLPLRQSFPNLVYYYEQVKINYEKSLNQMNETGYVNSHTYLNSQELSLLSQKLRDCQKHYEEMSDYLNLHLINKLRQQKVNNNNYCVNLTSMENQFKQLKDQMKSHSLQTQILKTQYQKLLKQVTLSQHNSQQQEKIIQTLKTKLLGNKQDQNKKLDYLSQLKTRQSLQHHNQSQLLNQLLQSRKLIHHLTHQQSQSTNQLQTFLQIQSQLNFQDQSAKLQLTSLQTSKSFKMYEQTSLSAENKLIQDQLTRLEHSYLTKHEQLQLINQTQIPPIIDQSQSLKQQNTKSTRFLTYLQTYENQLKSTSNLMFQQLKDCCKQDYQKLLNSNPKHLYPLIPTLASNPNYINSNLSSSYHQKPSLSKKKQSIRQTHINEQQELKQKENFESQK